jgi:hypothetical protein
MSRASVIPELPKEPLVVVRSSFVSLCSGDHCAAALLNNFLYWHNWCVDRERHDNTAQVADPGHQAPEPGYWFWKTGEDLESDLLGLFSGKKIRAATALLIEKGYVQSRNNPKDPFDRTKQFRLLTDRLRSDLEDISGREDLRATSSAPLTPALPAAAELDCPTRFGENAECTESSTYVDSTRGGESAPSIRQKDRIDVAKAPDVLTEITSSEKTSSSSSSRPFRADSSSLKRRMTNLLPSTSTSEPPQEANEPSTVEQAIAQWALDARIRRLRSDNTVGLPPVDLQRQWAAMIQEHGYTEQSQVADIMTAARCGADHATPGEWRAWNFLTLQVQLAAEQYRPHPPLPSAGEDSFTIQEFIKPELPSAEQIRSEIEELRQAIRELRAEYKSATHNNPYSNRGLQIEQQVRTHEQRLFALKGMLEGTVQAETIPRELRIG